MQIEYLCHLERLKIIFKVPQNLDTRKVIILAKIKGVPKIE